MRKRGRKCNQTLKLPATALKSTQSTVCASEQMAGLVAVKTMGRVSTHGLSQTHTHTRSNTHTQSHIPLVHFTHMVNKKFIILMGQQWGKVTQVTPSCCFIHHIVQMYLSCRYNIWTVGLMTSDVKNAGLSHMFFKKKVYKSCNKTQ